LRTDTGLDRKEALVEVLEFRIDKAWLLSVCDRGVQCCGTAGVLLMTPSRDCVYLSDRVDCSSPYDPSRPWRRRIYGDSAVLGRWPRTKRIYQALFSGAPVDCGGETEWNPQWGPVTGNCDIIVRERIKELR
jgi:hypothetical protein